MWKTFHIYPTKFLVNNVLNVLSLNWGLMCLQRESVISTVKIGKLKYALSLVIAMTFAMPLFLVDANAQVNNASPVNWRYPNGNAESTKYVSTKSEKQEIDSFLVKWSSPDISGDVQPLIGNVVNNGKLMTEFRYAPNEIAAVIGDELVVLSGTGRLLGKSSFTQGMEGVTPQGIKGISLLFDSTSAGVGLQEQGIMLMALETIEYQNDDTLAYSYVAGFDSQSMEPEMLRRLAIDLRPFDPNVSASIKPIFAKTENGEHLIYATVNMAKPNVDNAGSGFPPYFRGLTVFNTGGNLNSFPLPNVGDDTDFRLHLAPEVSFTTPSISFVEGQNSILLPVHNSTELQTGIDANSTVTDIGTTYADTPYLFGFSTLSNGIGQSVFPQDLSFVADGISRPVIIPYYIDLQDPTSSQDKFILLTEQYKGIDGSFGTSRLHLYYAEGDGSVTLAGDPVTIIDDPLNPPFTGGENHYWSVAVGNVDGNATNTWGDYYPNNPGNELILTQTSKEFAYASSKLMIMRYNSGQAIPKANLPDQYLFPFDTIATTNINGWVAAVNDLDGADDGKDEIVLVDGSKLLVVRLRNYTDKRFQTGKILDTLFVKEFSMQTISSVAISDLEGDELNDIIVTTYDSTYAIGLNKIKPLKVLFPNEYQEPPMEICYGDTLDIIWENLLGNTSDVILKFQEFSSGLPVNNAILIDEGIKNLTDTIVYSYIADTLVAGRQGRFILECSSNPGVMCDSTTLLSFGYPDIVFDSLEDEYYRVGELVNLTGSASCVDSVEVEWSEDNLNWDKICDLDNCHIDMGGISQFSINFEIPCVNFYNCSSPDSDSIIYIRLNLKKADYQGYSETLPIKVKPALAPVEFEKSETACPNIRISWQANDIEYTCDTISVSVSPDMGQTFTMIDRVATSEEEYIWNVPLETPDTLVVRVCCEGSCVRTDTVISNYKPKYIEIVAPNPFRPPLEEARVVYRVPEETNVTLRIYDQSDRVVAEPVSNVLRSPGIAYCETWDGTKDNGSPAANGMYYISLEFSSGVKEIYPLYLVK